MTPQRIQLSRAKGWRIPPNTVKVDRTTRWGNPFIVGAQGNAAQCVYWYGLMLCGYLNISEGKECCDRQEAAMAALKADQYASLRGKNLACWCRVGQPCHADLLLDLVNRRKREPLDIDAFLRRYGWTIEDGRAVRVESLRKLVDLADTQPFAAIGHLVEHVVPEARAALSRATGSEQ